MSLIQKSAANYNKEVKLCLLDRVSINDKVQHNSFVPEVEAAADMHNMEPGSVIMVEFVDFRKLYTSCPGCGACSFTGTHVITEIDGFITAYPSLIFSCCSWHGHLINNVFKPSN